jgi:hypothetical protein
MISKDQLSDYFHSKDGIDLLEINGVFTFRIYSQGF